MSQAIQLSASSSATQSQEEPKKNERRFSSLLAHLVTSLAVAIICGTAVAIATYFLTHGVRMWTAISGGGSAVISGLLTFALLQCIVGRTNRPHSLNSSISSEGKLTREEEPALTRTSVPSDRVQKKKADVKGTVYIHSVTSGPLRNDQHFEFSKKVQTENHESITFTEEDIYLELDGQFETGLFKEKFRFLDKDGLPMTHLYLPASLFEGIKEGGTIRFFYKDQLIELICKQATHPDLRGASWTFEDFLMCVKKNVRLDRSQGLWPDDIEGEPSFMGVLVGRSLVQLTNTHDKTTIQDFQYYEEDQKKHGPYQELQIEGEFRDCDQHIRVFNIHRNLLGISDIAFIESTGVNGLHQLWILIPHKPEQNQFPKDALKVTCHYRNHEKTFNKDSFCPQKGDRMSLYHYGQYFMCSLGDSKRAQLFFNSQGFLQLSIVLEVTPNDAIESLNGKETE